jgi:hypothetical protein
MAPGAHVFGPNRVGLWVIPNANLTDKLTHILPRARGAKAIPNLTDIFLPPEATLSHAKQCREAGYFVSTYDVTHNSPPGVVAAAMLANRAELKSGALEIDLEGAAVQPDKPNLAAWARSFVAVIRKTNPNLPIRLNVPPFKGYALPIELLTSDPQVFVIAQAYFGNQDGRCSEADVLLDLLDWGVPRHKAAVMYGVLAENPQGQRVYGLPNPEYKPITTGSVFSDDLLLDAGVL